MRVLFIFHPGRCKKAISNMMQPCKKRIERKENKLTLAELLKAKGLDDATINTIMEEMKANKIFTAGEENLVRRLRR